MVWLLVIAVSSALVLASVSLYRYGNWSRHHPVVTASVLTAWTFSLLIVFVLPLDVTSTVYRQCLQEHNKSLHKSIQNQTETFSSTWDDFELETCQEPWGMIPGHIFPNLWRIVYWSCQFLTWLVMPLMQSYIKAGDFTVRGKFKSALIDNAIYYGSYLFICGILLIYIALKPGVNLDWSKLKAIASSASNTWGLFLLILLLGYALVEVPRSLWLNSQPGYRLTCGYFKVAKLSTEKAEAEENVDDILESLQSISGSIPSGSSLRPLVDCIIQKVPPHLRDKINRRPSDGTLQPPPHVKTLIRLHKQVIKSLQTLQRSEALWSILVDQVLHFEEIAQNQNSISKKFQTDFHEPRSRLGHILHSSTIEWYWQCLLRPPCLKGLAVLSSIMSVCVVWSEVTFFIKTPVLSIFANIVNLAKDKYDYLTIEVFSMVTIAYLCYCSFSTVLKIKFLNLYYLAPHHQTNEHSLIFSGMMLCRLTPPMCLNFLGLIHMDSHIIKSRILETQYTQVMGHMDVIGIISEGFNIYFPIAVLAFCFATWFSLGRRALSALGFQQFMGDDSITTELVQEGRDLISREKRRRQRAEDSLLRKRDFQDRFQRQNSENRYMRPAGRGSSWNDSARAGLLHNAEPLAYQATPTTVSSDVVHGRPLSDELNERFGISTHLSNNHYDNGSSFGNRIDDHEYEENLGKGDDFNGKRAKSSSKNRDLLDFRVKMGESDSDDEDNAGHRTQVGVPPRRIFDDV